VYVNLGVASGVSEGDEFVADLLRLRPNGASGRTREVGRLRILRVTRFTSAARVVGLEHPDDEPGSSGPSRRQNAMTPSGSSEP
jgi:hypothetical protein